MAVYVNLEKPLVSQILVNGRTQMVEYESLSTIYFHCGRYGHVENMCNFKIPESTVVKDGNYGPWMIVERKSRRKVRDNP
ncbi:hypothetical protein ES332_A03G136500v1 [Gossypium tomentosum]|uniref:Zinc knuckle CX2CX4HX4C domain-containing protein n=1 Tax=Gossypium tomentosum TaxID=34277 RepID=A0A5D2R998_GOSTO|nr:hypothetical protein ES332_A03G136500v1 [Gossypium tomentosum]